MASLNVIALVGRAGADPELRYFESGSCKATLNLAVDDYSSSNEKKTYWIRVEGWGKTAEIMASYVTKGKQVGIQGSLKEDTWKDNEGKKRSRLYVHAERVQLLGSGNSSATTEQETAVAEEEF